MENDISCRAKCGSIATIRGVCANCYSYLNKLVRMGAISKEDLVEKGVLLPRKKYEEVKEKFNPCPSHGRVNRRK